MNDLLSDTYPDMPHPLHEGQGFSDNLDGIGVTGGLTSQVVAQAEREMLQRTSFEAARRNSMSSDVGLSDIGRQDSYLNAQGLFSPIPIR